jgi:hypothetical protein
MMVLFFFNFKKKVQGPFTFLKSGVILKIRGCLKLPSFFSQQEYHMFQIIMLQIIMERYKDLISIIYCMIKSIQRGMRRCSLYLLMRAYMRIYDNENNRASVERIDDEDQHEQLYM